MLQHSDSIWSAQPIFSDPRWRDQRLARLPARRIGLPARREGRVFDFRIHMRLILIAVTLHFIRHGVTFPFIPLLAEKMGAGPTTIGFIVGAFSLIAVFLSIPLGGLVDRFGIKRPLLFGVICNIVNAVILLHADTVSKLIAAQFIAGIAFLPHVVASQAFISRLPDASRREKGFGWLSFEIGRASCRERV